MQAEPPNPSLTDLLDSDDIVLLKDQVTRQLLIFKKQKDFYDEQIEKTRLATEQQAFGAIRLYLEWVLVRMNQKKHADEALLDVETPGISIPDEGVNKLFQSIGTQVKTLTQDSMDKETMILNIKMEKKAIENTLTERLHNMETLLAKEKLNGHGLLQRIDELEETLENQRVDASMAETANKKRLENELASAKAKLEDLRLENQGLAGQLKEYDASLLAVKKKLQTVKNEQVDALQVQIDQLSANLALTEKQYQDHLETCPAELAKAQQESSTQMNSLEKIINREESQIEFEKKSAAQAKEIGDLKEKIIGLEEEKAFLSDEISALKEEAAVLKDEKIELREKISDLIGQINILKEEIRILNVEKMGGCVDSPMSITELTETVDELRKELNAASTRFIDLENAKHDLHECFKQQQQEYEDAKKTHEEQIKELAAMGIEFSRLKTENESLNAKVGLLAENSKRDLDEIQRLSERNKEMQFEYETQTKLLKESEKQLASTIAESTKAHEEELLNLKKQLIDLQSEVENSSLARLSANELIGCFGENTASLLGLLKQPVNGPALFTQLSNKKHIDAAFLSIYTHIKTHAALIEDLESQKKIVVDKLEESKVKMDAKEEMIHKYYGLLKRLAQLFPNKGANPLLRSEFVDDKLISASFFSNGSTLEGELTLFCETGLKDLQRHYEESSDKLVNLDYTLKELKRELENYKEDYVLKLDYTRANDAMLKLQDELKRAKAALEDKTQAIQTLETAFKQISREKEVCVEESMQSQKLCEEKLSDMEKLVQVLEEINNEHKKKYHQLSADLDLAKREIRRLLISEGVDGGPLSAKKTTFGGDLGASTDKQHLATGSQRSVTSTSTTSSLQEVTGRRHSGSETPTYITSQPLSGRGSTHASGAGEDGSMGLSSMEWAPDSQVSSLDEGQLIYLKNAVFTYLVGREKRQMAVVLSRILNFSPEEMKEIEDNHQLFFGFPFGS